MSRKTAKTAAAKKPIHSMHKRLHVYWSGRVQGVGFRYTAELAAMELKLTGWIWNLPDGRVEALCEGSSVALKKFLDRVAAGPMRPNIRKTDVEWSSASGDFDDFHIRFF